MKKLMLLIAFISLVSYANAQHHYIPFPNSNAIWEQSCNGDEGESCPCTCYYGPCFTSSSKEDSLGTDTTINALTYYKLYYNYAESDWCDGEYCNNNGYFSYIKQYEGAIRQDTNLREVFIVPASSTVESLLYDFNLNVGDTLPASYINQLNSYFVSKIDSILLKGTYHKQFWICGLNDTIGCGDTGIVAIIEGIGSTFGLLSTLEEGDGMGDGTFCTLNCVSINSNPVYPDTSTVCVPIITAIRNYNNTASFSIYPNPSADNITIESPQQSTIEIYNIQGQLIETLAANNNTLNIDVSAFPNGIYILEMKTEKEIEVKKFVKE